MLCIGTQYDGDFMGNGTTHEDNLSAHEPKYFLTYVHSAKHASLILSRQDNPPDGVTRIVSQNGFWPEDAYATEESFIKSNLSQWRGVLQDDDMASRAMYSSQDIFQRTYEISKREAQMYEAIIYRDKQTYQKKGLDDAAAQSAKNATQYRYIGYNCKSYALNVFKELGIVDANRLHNFLIQVPGSKQNKTNDLTSDVLSCPLKDNFIKENILLLETLEQFLKSIELDSIEDKEQKKALQEVVQFIANAKPSLVENIKKVGFDNKVNIQYSGMLDSIRTLVERIPEDQPQMLATATTILEDMQNQEQVFTQIVEHYKNHTLPIEWVGQPVVQPRVSFENFDDVEKAIYLIDRRAQDMSDAFNHMLTMIEETLQEKELANELVEDLKFLKETVTDAKQALADNKRPKNADKLEDYLEHYKSLESIMKNLEKKVAEYKPKAEVESRPFVKLIKQIISFFKKDYNILSIDPKAVLQNSISKKTKKYARGKKFTQLFNRKIKQSDGYDLADPNAAQQPQKQQQNKKKGKLLTPQRNQEKAKGLNQEFKAHLEETLQKKQRKDVKKPKSRSKK